MTLAATRVELVEWHALGASERAAVLALRINEAQLEFAGPIARSVAACEAGDRVEVAGLAVRAGHDIVGWVVLKRGASAPDWVEAGAAVVSGLRIDAGQQGRGLGGAALQAMADWVTSHWPSTTALMLRVDDGNAAGIRAYEKAGWTEIGERRVGRVGVERTMALLL